MTGFDRGCGKTLHSSENERAQHDRRRSAYLSSLRMLENSVKIGVSDQSPKFLHSVDPLLPFAEPLPNGVS
jgi:hypothetical protein